MRKTIIAIVAAASCAAPMSTKAEGYQVNTLSARQNGMGHTGVAQKLGSESMLFNPSGMAFMDSTVDFSASVTGTFADASARLADGKKYTTSNDPSTPIAAHLGMSVYQNLKVGLSFYTPYGSGINWGEDWPGAVLNQSVDLKAYTIQPTVAYRILPTLSAGAGLMVTWGTVDLNKGLVPGATFAAMMPGWSATSTPASINLNGKANIAVGYNIGAMWDISSKVTVGASFRSEMKLKVKKGKANITYANETADAILSSNLHILNQAEFAASMPCPWVFNIGTAVKPVDKLLLAFDAQLTGWKSYKQLNIDFLSDQIPAVYDQHIPKHYRNSWTFKLGGQYSLTERFDLRLGLMLDTTPVNSHHYNPETPGMTKLSPSAGFSFTPLRCLTINASLLYVAGLGKDNASVEYTNLLTQQSETFSADYRVHAWNPSLGVTLKF